MAGLLIKELMVRGDVSRCLIVPPGSLVEQWHDELGQKLGLEFEIITRDSIEASRSGNPFAEKNLVIARLDQLSRNEDVQAKLEQTDWDLVVVDEAHKMSAHFFGYEVKKTRRYQLGELLGRVTVLPSSWSSRQARRRPFHAAEHGRWRAVLVHASTVSARMPVSSSRRLAVSWAPNASAR